MLCACLGLTARTIVPAAGAWRPAAPPARTPATTSRGGRGGVAFSAAAPWKNSFIPSTTPRQALFSSSASSKAEPISRLGHSRQGYRLAWGGAVGVGGAGAVEGTRGRGGRPLMSMAEDGGAKGVDHNAVLGALALAGLGAIYYG